MFEGIRSTEWYVHNESRAYPLAVSADGETTDGLFVLPNSTLLAVYIYLPWSRDIDPSRFYLQRLVVTGTTVSAAFAYAPVSGSPTTVATATITTTTSDTPSVRELVPATGWEDVAGNITFGSGASLTFLPFGIYEFSLENARLEVDCVRPSARNLSGLQIEGSSGAFSSATGTVTLRAGSNTRLRTTATGGVNDIWIDAIQGANLNESCECGDALTNPIRTINAVQPGPDGNMDFIGAKCMDIAASTGVVAFNNPCSEPCCGCEEAEALQAAINTFGPQLNQLTNFVTNMSTQMDRIETISGRVSTSGGACDPEMGDGGLPPVVPPPIDATTTTSSPTTTTSSLPFPTVVSAVPRYHGDLVNGVFSSVEGAGDGLLDWKYLHRNPAMPDTRCSVEDQLAGNCPEWSYPIDAQHAAEVQIVPQFGGGTIDIDLFNGNATVDCGGSEEAPTTTFNFRLIARAYVQNMSHVRLLMPMQGMSQNDYVDLWVKPRTVIGASGTEDLTGLPQDKSAEGPRVGMASKTDFVNCGTTGPEMYTYGPGYTVASSLIGPTFQLLAPGWYDLVIDVRRAPGNRVGGVMRIILDTRTACQPAGPTRQYVLAAPNLVNTENLVLSLSADVGTVTPATTNTHILRQQGQIVTVDSSATTLTLSDGDQTLSFAVGTMPARRSWNFHPGANPPSPTDNYLIQLAPVDPC